MPRPLLDVPAADLVMVLPAALDGTGPAVAVRAGAGPTTGASPTAGLVPDEVAVVVHTSGSTGEPREVMLTAEALRASARASADRLGGPGQWVAALPVEHVAGLQVLVRSLLAGTEPVSLPPGPFQVSGFVAAVRALPDLTTPSFCSLVPTQVARLLADPAGADALASFAAVLVGGAALPGSLRARAEAAGVRLVTTYGATETCGGAVYDGRALDGVEVELVDGRVELSGPVLAHGYRDRPDLDALWLPVREGRRRFVTRDLGQMAADGRLEVLGRADDVLITGGLKVAPQAVEQVLVTSPTVREVLVVGVPDPHWGQEVTAVAVPTPGDRPNLADLRALVAARLGTAAAPRRLVLVDALPTLTLGKPDRRAATALATRHRDDTTLDHDPTRDDLEVDRGDDS
ncbi:MAG: o-succinylbenzoate--CoA ligase [Micrococcales bacterium]|nr:o-succinylbenzoate--CoA ligase [Micrococcales bacterium]